jgi:hypothetical protein
MNAVRNNDARSILALNWFLFLLNPFVSLCVSLTAYKSGIAKNIIWAGCVFYGLMFNILPGQGTDALRYAEDLKQMHLTQISWELLSTTFYQEGQTRFDIYQPTLTLLVSRFTNDYHYLFAVFGIGIGYFYSRTLWYFVERLPQNCTLINFLFLLSAAFIVNPGSAINGVRMYTAFYVFLYAALRYLENPNFRFLALAASSILIHFSFTYAFLLLLAVPISEKLPGLTMTAFTLSFFIQSFENSTISDLLGFLPGFQQRVSSYLVSPDTREEQLGWLLKLCHQGSLAFVLASAYLLPALLRELDNRAFNRLAVLALLIYTGVNLFWNVYSFARFSSITLLLLCGLWSIVPSNSAILRAPFQLFGFPLLLLISPLVAVGIRLCLGFVSIGILLGNPVTFTWFYDADSSAYDFLLANFRPW